MRAILLVVLLTNFLADAQFVIPQSFERCRRCCDASASLFQFSKIDEAIIKQSCVETGCTFSEKNDFSGSCESVSETFPILASVVGRELNKEERSNVVNDFAQGIETLNFPDDIEYEYESLIDRRKKVTVGCNLGRDFLHLGGSFQPGLEGVRCEAGSLDVVSKQEVKDILSGLKTSDGPKITVGQCEKCCNTLDQDFDAGTEKNVNRFNAVACISGCVNQNPCFENSVSSTRLGCMLGIDFLLKGEVKLGKDTFACVSGTLSKLASVNNENNGTEDGNNTNLYVLGVAGSIVVGLMIVLLYYSFRSSSATGSVNRSSSNVWFSPRKNNFRGKEFTLESMHESNFPGNVSEFGSIATGQLRGMIQNRGSFETQELNSQNIPRKINSFTHIQMPNPYYTGPPQAVPNILSVKSVGSTSHQSVKSAGTQRSIKSQKTKATVASDKSNKSVGSKSSKKTPARENVDDYLNTARKDSTNASFFRSGGFAEVDIDEEQPVPPIPPRKIKSVPEYQYDVFEHQPHN